LDTVTTYCWPVFRVNCAGVNPVAVTCPPWARVVHMPVSACPDVYWLPTVRDTVLVWPHAFSIAEKGGVAARARASAAANARVADFLAIATM
jgi:hypothetical protein